MLLVRMCLCLVGTHEFMFSCMNMSVFYWYVCVFVGLVRTSLCLILRICLCSVVCTCKSLRVSVCISGVGMYEPMFSCKNISVLREVFVGTCVSLFSWYICVYVLCYE